MISGRNFYAFQGIPYAKPPVGKHRFKPSVPAGPWTGVYDATRTPNMCIQVASVFSMIESSLDVLGSEDCLYLNVFSPKPTVREPTHEDLWWNKQFWVLIFNLVFMLPEEQAGGKLLDVIVYIHGGAFQIGSGSDEGPMILLDRDVILVTINYRLGVMGFLSFEDNAVPGNNGLKDQVLALKWVQNHIADFGGDPNKVTIAGMSAGGASVHFQMLSASSQGLFQKAISNSGSALNPWALARNARAASLLFAQTVGCPVNNTILALKCLRERPAENLVGIVSSMTGGNPLAVPFSPVVEPLGPNAFITEHPIDLIESNSGSDVPALFSYCDDEGSWFALGAFEDDKAVEAIESNWDAILPQAAMFNVEPAKGIEIAQKIRKHFLGDKKVKDSMREYSQLYGEILLADGIQKAAMLLAERRTSPVYSYRFSFITPNDLVKLDLPFERLQYKGGAPHGSDNVFLFDTIYLKPITDFPELLPMVKTMTDVWMKFITEDPVSSWSTVKSGLPKFTYLDIWSPNPSENTFKSEESLGQLFWDSLNLPRSNAESTQNDAHTEL